MLTAKRLSINGVELDLKTRSLRRNGEKVQLRAKTFELLLFFIEHRDRLVTKDELISELWQGAPVTMDALVQTVLDLRRTLGDEAQNPKFIKTVSKVGYQLIATVEEIGPEPVEEEPPEAKPSAPAASAPSWRRRWMAGAVVGVVLIAGGLTVRWALMSPEPEWWEVAWWKLNEGNGTSISDSIHGLKAVLPPGVLWTQGISGSGLLFPGRELIVRGNDPNVLPKGDSPRTITAWIKAGTTNADSTSIFLAGNPKPDTFTGCGLSLHESGAAAFGCGHSPMLLAKERIDDDRWHQVTGVFEGSESRRVRLFVDGFERDSGVAPPINMSKQSDWTIGTGFTGGTGFRGAIDDIRVYERPLRADEIHTLYRCLTRAEDIQVEGRGAYQFIPIFGDHVETIPESGEGSVRVKNTGKDFAGIVFARPNSDCALRSLHGADLGQDLNIEAQLRVPLGPNGAVSDAGPFFRSRRANPGDGIVGGTSAGFWVLLDSTGQVRVRRLHPGAVLAFSNAVEGFDPEAFHNLEVAVHGETLEVALDGRLVTFDASGAKMTSLPLQPAWLSASPKGSNGGAGGIAFSCTRNRGQAGGQEARNIRVKPYRSLRS